MPTQPILRTPKRRAWLVMLVMLAVVAAALGGVYWWRWAHRPPGLRVVARYYSTRVATTAPDGYALAKHSTSSDEVSPITFHDWSGREAWRIDGGESDLSRRSDSRAYRFSPDGRWHVHAFRVHGLPDTIMLWRDGRLVRTCEVEKVCDEVVVTDDGTTWLIDHAHDTLTVTAVGPERTRVGRVNLPAPFPRTDDRGRSPRAVREEEAEREAMDMGPRYGIAGARVSEDGVSLNIGAYDQYGMSCRREYPNYRTYCIRTLSDRLALERTGADGTTVREVFPKKDDGSTSNTATTPAGAAWTVPGAPVFVGNLAQTADGRFAVACRVVSTPESPGIAMLRAKWAALRRVPYTPAAPDCRLTIDLYEQPGILRGTTTLPFSDARINQFSAGSIGIAPDGRAVLVQAEGTVHLLRW